MERSLCRSSKHRLVRQRGGTGTTSVAPTATLLNVANCEPALGVIINYLDPRFAEDLEDADPSALLALLEKRRDRQNDNHDDLATPINDGPTGAE